MVRRSTNFDSFFICERHSRPCNPCTVPDGLLLDPVYINLGEKGWSFENPLSAGCQPKVGQTGPKFPAHLSLDRQLTPQNAAVAPFPLSPEESHALTSTLSYFWHQFHENEDSTVVINLGGYTRTEVKRANAIANTNVSPTHDDESAESPKSEGAMRSLAFSDRSCFLEYGTRAALRSTPSENSV